MKNASAGLKSLFASSRQFLMADLWAITLRNGTALYYTSWDADLTVGGVLYKSHDVVLSGGKLKQVRGLEVNETDLTCYPSLGATWPASMVGQLPFLQAVSIGMFDRATVTRQRIFMPTPGDASLGPIDLFIGEVTDTTSTRNTAVLKCKDATNLLNIYMPRRQYQPTCSWTFGDSNCTFNKAALTVASSVGAGSGGNLILCGLTQAAGYFNYGTVKFTSGKNAGIARAVKNYSVGAITLTGPFPAAIAVGDEFQITPGCSKTINGTSEQFNGAAASGLSPSIISNNIGSAAGTFNGYTMTFTSGPLAGQSSIISSWSPNRAVMSKPFTLAPNGGDDFTLFAPNGAVAAYAEAMTTLSQSFIPVNLPMADGFFNNGTLQFTSGNNVGQSLVISSWQGGTAVMANPFPNAIAVGDECTLTTAVSNTQATCTGYNNAVNFGGQDQIPIPETAY